MKKKSRGKQSNIGIDWSVMVDLISNAAGMMMLFVCITLVVDTDRKQTPAKVNAKPIDFPLAYLPVKQNPITVALKGGRFYRLPAGELLKEVIRVTESGKTVNFLDVQHEGVLARIQFAPLGLGYRYFYKLQPDGGVPLDRPIALKRRLDALIEQFPPDRYYISIQCWPDQFAYLKTVREYLIEKHVVVGWDCRLEEDDSSWDLMFARGDYDKRLSSIKAQ